MTGPRILAIESSCDETGVAIVVGGRRIEANQVATQVALHAATGGIVPEVAARPDELDTPLLDPREPRDYQREALRRWRAAERRGTVVLPTGAGKTLVAIMAINDVRAGACIVAPTRALVTQWFAQLADAFGAERVGAWYGDE